MKPPSELISDHDVMTCPACGETIRAKIHVALQVGDPALSGTGKCVCMGRRQLSLGPTHHHGPHMSTREDRDEEARREGRPACHPDSMWTCLGCEADQCDRCDGIAGESGTCWTCFNTEDPEAVA